jgi:hypothetical protein
MEEPVEVGLQSFVKRMVMSVPTKLYEIFLRVYNFKHDDRTKF